MKRLATGFLFSLPGRELDGILTGVMSRRILPSLLTSIVLFSCLVSTCGVWSGDWPQWRGEGRSGVWEGVRLPQKMTAEDVKKRWSVPVGGGYSGIAVAGGRVFTMDRSKATEREAERTEKAARERVLCFDVETGKSRWAYEYSADYGDMDHDKGPRSTPTVRGDRVYTLGAVGHLACLRAATGSPLWSIDVATKFDIKMPIWGHSVSPLIEGPLVIVQVGARPDGTVLAFDVDTGEERWRALEDRPGYSSPIVMENRGKKQLVVWTADNIVGLVPSSGKVLWSVPFRTSSYDVAIISPVVADDRLFVSGYWDGSGAFSLGKSPPESSWKVDMPACLMATPLYRDGHLYALDKRQGVVCLDWKTGKVLWKDGHRITPKGRNPHASMVWAGTRVVILNTPGELILGEFTPSGYEEHGRVPIVGETWSHPAFSGQDVFARSDTELVCFRVSAK